MKYINTQLDFYKDNNDNFTEQQYDKLIDAITETAEKHNFTCIGSWDIKEE